MNTFKEIFDLSVIIIEVLVAVAAIIIVLRRKAKGNKYHRNPIGFKLSRAKQRAVNFGAILTEMNHEFCDSLRAVTFGAMQSPKRSLKEWWGISSKADAEEALESLKNIGHRQMFNVILLNAEESLSREPSFEDFLTAYKRSGLPIIDEEISKQYGRESSLSEMYINTKYNAYVKYANNLRQTLDKLRSRGFAGELKELSRINAAAWDMGRMVNVAKWCYTCGYITEDKAWEYIFFAEKESLHYTDWAAFSNAYLVGRALWGGDNELLDVAMNVVDGLLKDKESPWKQMALR